MSIDKELLDRLMEGRSPGDLFGKTGILAELTKALAERALLAARWFWTYLAIGTAASIRC